MNRFIKSPLDIPPVTPPPNKVWENDYYNVYRQSSGGVTGYISDMKSKPVNALTCLSVDNAGFADETSSKDGTLVSTGKPFSCTEAGKSKGKGELRYDKTPFVKLTRSLNAEYLCYAAFISAIKNTENIEMKEMTIHAYDGSDLKQVDEIIPGDTKRQPGEPSWFDKSKTQSFSIVGKYTVDGKEHGTTFAFTHDPLDGEIVEGKVDIINVSQEYVGVQSSVIILCYSGPDKACDTKTISAKDNKPNPELAIDVYNRHVPSTMECLLPRVKRKELMPRVEEKAPAPRISCLLKTME